MTQRAVAVDGELQDAVTDRLADVKSLLVRRYAYSVGIIEVVRYFHPFLTTGRKTKNFSNHSCWYWWIGVWAENCGISAAVGSDHNIIYPAIKFLTVTINIPPSQLFPCHVEFQDCAWVVGACEQESLLFRERQAVMAATLGMI